MDLSDMLKNTLALAAVTAVSAGALAIGTLASRHPDTARRSAKALLQSAQRIGVAMAQAREDLGDVWAEVRDDLRNDLAVSELGRAAQSWAGGSAESDTPSTAQADEVPTVRPARRGAAGNGSARQPPGSKRTARTATKRPSRTH